MLELQPNIPASQAFEHNWCHQGQGMRVGSMPKMLWNNGFYEPQACACTGLHLTVRVGNSAGQLQDKSLVAVKLE